MEVVETDTLVLSLMLQASSLSVMLAVKSSQMSSTRCPSLSCLSDFFSHERVLQDLYALFLFFSSWDRGHLWTRVILEKVNIFIGTRTGIKVGLRNNRNQGCDWPRAAAGTILDEPVADGSCSGPVPEGGVPGCWALRS